MTKKKEGCVLITCNIVENTMLKLNTYHLLEKFSRKDPSFTKDEFYSEIVELGTEKYKENKAKKEGK